MLGSTKDFLKPTAEACWNRCTFLLLNERALGGFNHDGALAIMKKPLEAE